jgi:brefeldin A-inhibited guanine nucleotide-exchange protein
MAQDEEREHVEDTTLDDREGADNDHDYIESPSKRRPAAIVISPAIQNEGDAGDTSDGSDDNSSEAPRSGFFSPTEDVHPQVDEQHEDNPPREEIIQDIAPVADMETSQTPTEQEPLPVLGKEDTIVGPGEPRGSTEDSVTTATVEDGQAEIPPTLTVEAPRASTISSMVFVATALEKIATYKDARRKKDLNDSVRAALTAIKEDKPIEPEAIFEPLRLATETTNSELTTTALDCIGKLITYSYFSLAPAPLSQDPSKQQAPLIERAIDTICDCFQDEATPADVQLQIVKSLLAAVLSDKIVVHGAGLLKAVRQVYNIFLLSKTPQSQQIAQGTLTQMVGTVFERVKVRLAQKEARLDDSKLASDRGTSSGSQVDINGRGNSGSSPYLDHEHDDVDDDRDAASDAMSTVTTDQPGSNEKMTLQSFENQKNFDDTRIADNAPTMVTRARPSSKQGSMSAQEGVEVQAEEDDEDEIYVKDAFLVFRSMCRLSTKVLMQEQQQDLRSQPMRSKLVSLSIIRMLMNNNLEVFTSPLVTIRGNANEATSFGQAINQYLRLALSRNGASSVRQVFELSCEIFWLMLSNMRVMLKREIEVFLKEIYLAILERRTAPSFQKLYIMRIIRRLASDPKALVELYLNYDCDRSALDNIFQKTIELLAKISSSPMTASPQQQQLYHEQQEKDATADMDWKDRGRIPPSLTTAALANSASAESDLPVEFVMKQLALECLVRTLRSLLDWSQASLAENAASKLTDVTLNASFDEARLSVDRAGASPRPSGADTPLGPSTPLVEDDPGRFEKAKQKKTALVNGIKQFNFKPKRGIKLLLEGGFIPSNSPSDIAAFILQHDTLDKAMVGEYLGEGEPENIAIMHAFVDSMEFANRRFVDALRQFLQSFRLPGEAQKIDRFMLKFAERYITGNPKAFANADTAYVLAYSVILLNTDQHSKKMKGPRMTPLDFIKNNRGINDNADLPDEYLNGIYEEITNNEIVLTSEREHAAALGITVQPNAGGLTSGFFTKDLTKDAAHQADQEMSSKAEQRLRSLIRAQRKLATKPGAIRYIPATSFKHVGPMFDVVWMSFLSGFSGPMQNTQNLATIKLCMEGIKLAIKISCTFDCETARTAFVTFLANSTNLGNVREMMAKNLEALKVLLEIALTEGNSLKSSWEEILTCISQLDRLQLISGGMDEDVVPDVKRVSTAQSSKPPSRRGASRRPQPIQSKHGSQYQPEIAQETRSTSMVKLVDRIFTGTAQLSGDAIVHFVRALSEVSWQEIQSSGHSDSPRMYSLQKIVEISYYNMTRVRFEWTNIWTVLGEHFNQVGCHNNTNIVFSALDSLRQLSMRFMEIEELPGFKFQKDFLKPFEHVLANSSTVTVKDMVLRCLIQMIQARGDNIRSGWKTMFGAFTVAAREPYEAIVNLSIDNVTQVYNNRFGVIIAQGAFPDLVVCLTEFSKNSKFQKKSLQAIDTLKSTVPRMLRTPECPLAHKNGSPPPRSQTTENVVISRYANRQTQEEQFWFPVLFAFHDVLMTGEDLEVRSQALTYLFDTLVKYGGDFPPSFWDTLWRQLLYPIFMVLKSKSEMNKAANHEDLSFWLSTTMIQALRNMIGLFTHYFESLEYMLDRFLDLLALCICQENDTIARIGSNCLQTLILQNVSKFQANHWHQIVSSFVELFDRTTAHQLFTATTSTSNTSEISEGDDGRISSRGNEPTSQEAPSSPSTVASQQNGANGLQLDTDQDQLERSASGDDAKTPTANTDQELENFRPQNAQQQQPVVVTAARRRFFNKIITRCVLQLLMIETVNELFSNNDVYAQIPSPELLRLMTMLKKSYQFAKKFNNDKELRMRLWHEGFMKQPPNLLKQESGSAATYVSILVRMYFDEGEERRSNRAETEAALIP